MEFRVLDSVRVRRVDGTQRAPKTASKAYGVGKEPRFQMALGVGIENRRMDFVQTWWQLRLERSQHILWIGRIDIDEHDELIRS